jgi:endonuclease/exonuclease/phosphatase family metal-dependent hydrolase
MRTPSSPFSLRSIVLTAGLAACVATVLPLSACSTGTSGDVRGFVLDGDTREWRGGITTRADDETVSFRFSPGNEATLQANDETTRLLFDLDNNPATGEPLVGPPDVGTLGVDLEILMSPLLTDLPPASAASIRNRRLERGQPASPFATGITIIRNNADGTITRLKHADIGFMASPTYASDYFEARIDRTSDALVGTGIDTEGDMRAIVLMTGTAGEVVRYSEPIDFVLPEAASERRLTTKGIPAQQPGTIRVLSMNVLRGKPQTEPAPFARLITAIEPDVILFQEADDFDAPALEAWLSGFVGPMPGKHEWASGIQGLSGNLTGGVGVWDAAAMPDLGVAIATPHVITQAYDGPVEIEDPRNGRPRTVRAVTALISTPAGDILATSTHLKCCGSAGSEEDTLRYAEAGAINAAFASAIDDVRGSLGRDIDAKIIGGDMNLVGTRGPLDVLRAGLASGGGDLRPAMTGVIGETALYTWRDDRGYFSPGRLDWFVTGDATVAQAFALDTRLMDADRLAEWGLYPDDSAVSDHLPVVVDLMP